ncbi:MAG TPA: penicillin-binding protein 2 [Candidatus Magasanikbacteria bacterium]|uniref:Penicillin-binding protein 2 n=2 Tax=Candidatus Magasanikiibacteriota TaxID=1752731 RepID=A0A0G1A668_9BACT|nr:MAG: Penicillin-binding protein 2 [Candidatus Magasanikbacteria bacterium GW2011_GWC2_41_17]KKS56582.1 MAG: Penicillin-binding protein 2 [Candidatus Magasanikbacteria bacterium GW2011_GWA2_42_32]HBV58197.1 penicillin-binding protein 2 [Candidatus Magasanikbacteria bacterium]HBX15862.1 penicillin-binding protein 2 [Candidatus Magasanikbacteria bacterium]
MIKNFLRRRDPFVIKTNKLSNPDISGVIKKRWVEDSFSGDFKNTPEPIKEFLGLAISKKRFFWLGAIISLLFVIVFGRLAYLEIFQGEKYRQLAENNRLRVKPIPAERGIIYDRNLVPLLANIPNFTLNLLPQDLPKDEIQREEVINKISALAQIPTEEIKNKIEEFKDFSYRSINIRDNLDYETAVLLNVASAEFPGMSVEISSRRQYFFTEPTAASTIITTSLSHLFGYMGKVNKDDLTLNPNYLPTDFIGKSGLEKTYEKDLRGTYGKREIEVDAFGKEKNTVSVDAPQAGKNLILAIDLNLQKKLEESLATELRASNKKKASAVALDPKNGEILALVNLPTYNNNLFSRGISFEEYQKLLVDPNAPMFSRAWAGSFPSGSVIKPIIAAAALSEGLINRQTTFLSSGGLQINTWFFPDWKAGGHGATNVVKALAESVNTFFYIIGGGYENFAGLGLEKIAEYLKKFGLANTLGIDLPGETAGFIPSREWKEDIKKERWYIGDTYNLSIGQGDLLVTPLQVANYTAIIANGGTSYRPHIVKNIENSETKEKIDIVPKIIEKNVLPDSILKIVREGMRSTIISGSAQLLNTLPIAVAGKTGTAQWSSKYSPHAWFTGFGPYENPQIVLTILIEEGGEGSHVAVPVAREVFDWWAKNR